MIDASFVNAITTNAATAVLTVGEDQYVTKQVYNVPLPEEPTCSPLEVDTLSGLCDYIAGALDRDQLKASELIVHIESATRVQLYSAIKGVHRTREVYIEASVPGEGFPFGQYLPHANFMIGLQTQFEDYGDRAAIMKIVGTIKAEASKTSRDDGVSQSVVAASGIALNSEVLLPNPVMLRPRRSFVEIEQVPSQFVLRVQDKPGQLPTIALFEADGGAWQLEAMANIKEFIVAKIGESGVVVLA